VVAGRIYVTDRQLSPGVKNPNELFPTRPAKSIAGVERIVCLNAADGKEIRKSEYDCPYTVSYPAGPWATPLVRDGKLYNLGTEGNLYCLDTRDGKVLWSHELKKEYKCAAPLWGYSSHPLLDGNKLITMVGGKGSAVAAFDKDSGKELWHSLTAGEDGDKGEIGYSSPMIYQAGGVRQLIVWHATAVCGLDPETGKEYWTYPIKVYQGMAIATPRRVGDLLFLTSYPANATALKLNADNPSIEKGWVGAPKKSLFSVFGTPFSQDGYLYGSSSGGTLVWLKGDTGEKLWETLDPAGGKPLASADFFLIKNGDRFFIPNEKGALIIAKLTPKGYEQISKAHLLEPTGTAFGRLVLWSHPAFADRKMFWRNDKELICVDLAAEAGRLASASRRPVRGPYQISHARRVPCPRLCVGM
jgi:outer membrane protein assembly factor BamB